MELPNAALTEDSQLIEEIVEKVYVQIEIFEMGEIENELKRIKRLMIIESKKKTIQEKVTSEVVKEKLKQ